MSQHRHPARETKPSLSSSERILSPKHPQLPMLSHPLRRYSAQPHLLSDKQLTICQSTCGCLTRPNPFAENKDEEPFTLSSRKSARLATCHSSHGTPNCEAYRVAQEYPFYIALQAYVVQQSHPRYCSHAPSYALSRSTYYNTVYQVLHYSSLWSNRRRKLYMVATHKQGDVFYALPTLLTSHY